MTRQPSTVNRQPSILAIVGPTAIGKSRLAIQIAKIKPAEIISADSMQVYAGMNIGTSKISGNVRKQIKHHLIDVVSIKETFNAVTYQNLARLAIAEISGKDKLPILVGGTGLYIRSAIYKLDFPEKAADDKIRIKLENALKNKGLDYLQHELKMKDRQAFDSIDINNSRRVIRALEIIEITGKPYSDSRQDWQQFQPAYDNILIGLTKPRELLYEDINERVDEMVDSGLVEETKDLIDNGLKEAMVARQALGYKELIEYLDGQTSLEEAVETIKKRTRSYAKRQYTWFKKDPNVRWFDVSEVPTKDIAEQVVREL